MLDDNPGKNGPFEGYASADPDKSRIRRRKACSIYLNNGLGARGTPVCHPDKSLGAGVVPGDDLPPSPACFGWAGNRASCAAVACGLSVTLGENPESRHQAFLLIVRASTGVLGQLPVVVSPFQPKEMGEFPSYFCVIGGVLKKNSDP